MLLYLLLSSVLSRNRSLNIHDCFSDPSPFSSPFANVRLTSGVFWNLNTVSTLLPSILLNYVGCLPSEGNEGSSVSQI